MPFFGRDTASEKRTAAALPSLRNDDGTLNTEISAQLEQYVSEHFAARARLVTTNNLLHTSLFGVSPEEKVVAGSDGWLYFAETMDDYCGRSLLSPRGINNLARTLELINDYCRLNEADFVFAPVPNKATIYGENVPAWYIAGEKSNLSALTSALDGSSVKLADLYTALCDSDEQLYHKRDSHWNNSGAVVACNTILDALGLPRPSYDLAVREVRDDWEGDLDAMIYPTLGFLDRQIYYPDVAEHFSFTGSRNSSSDPDVHTTAENGANTSLLFFRDSFLNAMLQFIAPAVSEARFLSYVPYRLDYLEDGDYNAVIIEIAQRNIENLLHTAPVLPASPVTLSGTLSEKASDSSPVQLTEDEFGYNLICGELDPALLTDTGEIYLLAQKDGKTLVFPAFPINEYGFALRLQKGTVDESWTLSPLIREGGQLIKIIPVK